MPLFYTSVPGATQTTNATPNTANDCFFIKPGTRSIWVNELTPGGYGASLTAISAIVVQFEKWTTTASSGGTAVTPSPNDIGYQAAKATAGWAAGAVTSGTGGPTLLKSLTMGSTTPGNWIVPLSALDQAYSLEGSANQSIDVFNISAVANANFRMSVGHVE